MSRYAQAKFMLSANALKQFPPDTGREVAVAGRSNAGKSSAINAIVNRRQLARTSKTPGRTRLLNFFSLSDSERLVDLPGYGYARVSQSVRRRWGDLLQSYFETRRSLRGLFLVVDIRREISDIDYQMLRFAESVRVPVHVLLTKADKLNPSQSSATRRRVQKELEGKANVQLFSALNRQGVEDARQALQQFLSA